MCRTCADFLLSNSATAFPSKASHLASSSNVPNPRTRAASTPAEHLDDIKFPPEAAHRSSNKARPRSSPSQGSALASTARSSWASTPLWPATAATRSALVSSSRRTAKGNASPNVARPTPSSVAFKNGHKTKAPGSSSPPGLTLASCAELAAAPRPPALLGSRGGSLSAAASTAGPGSAGACRGGEHVTAHLCCGPISGTGCRKACAPTTVRPRGVSRLE
mmetsp:Transcript_91145/g.260777  ORF Transcript_91145/g.260777 Transcript_91145/m.260777 type:complete len:220 (-) Transcript_91145:83-742(-)